MKYARLNGQELVPAPKTAEVNGLTVCNPTREQYISIGWYPVVFTECPELDPESGNMAVPHWEQAGAEIRQVWEIVPVPEPEQMPPPQPTTEERLHKLEKDQEDQWLAMAEMTFGGGEML